MRKDLKSIINQNVINCVETKLADGWSERM